jgi:hypothetical protein
MTLTLAQRAALAHLKKSYMGPEQGDSEVLTNRPSLQYSVGMLFPSFGGPPSNQESAIETNPSEFVSADVADGDVEENGAAVTLAEDWRPSSAALSFVTDVQSFVCDFSAATYAAVVDEGPLRWARKGHAFPSMTLSRLDASHRLLDLGGVPVEIGSRWRVYGQAWLVTVHVRVRAQSTGNDRDDISFTLFQVALSVSTAGGGRILEYDVSPALDIDSESRELRVRYRDRKVLGVGHGMAAGWEIDESGECARVFLDPVPHFVVPAIEQAVGPDLGLTDSAMRALDLEFLQGIDANPGSVTAALSDFVDAFGVWAQSQVREAQGLGSDAQNIAARSKEAAERMLSGVSLLADEVNEQIRVAFALSMAAMRLQMRQSALGRGVVEPRPAWRPFQLGFILVSLASSTDQGHKERELVDLIWFPTGGGKTEAYLAISAIVMFLRRLKYGLSGGGTAVVTRYTLRLLTSQQFQRAASLICAMELLRSQDDRARGMARFTIGLWVGNDVTPGTRAEARISLERLYKARNPREANQFQVTECPWCMMELVPEERDDTKRAYGARAIGNDIAFFCINPHCEFFSRELPMAVVDDVLYDNPPTFLLATVDKFARLQFNEQAGRLLGIGTAFKQPDLIIQDELHLLSGPLGTTVAVFDAVILLLLTQSGTRPKIVASTATIRASAEQVQGLYGRSVALYPPAGLDGDTTFFARPVQSGEGRMYVGLMPQSVPQQTALIGAVSPMLEIPGVLSEVVGMEGRRDPYWTLVLYHNSLRELGRTGALLLDDVNARLETRSERLGIELRDVRGASVLELTSRRQPEELPSDLRRLNVSVDQSVEAVDVVLSSNMLSVGIDVQRLALMLMVGQPKTTAEYIQASSRVGRGHINGIVVTLFRSNRARDRSHFETFRGYHDGLYRTVEPTSVTPWSLSSRDRSLAGALVALIRNSFPELVGNSSAGGFDLADEHFRKRLEVLVGRLVDTVDKADRQESEESSEQIWRLLREWDRLAGEARVDGEVLRYERRTQGGTGLLKRFGQSGPGWLVGDSMRSVEASVAVEVQEPLREVERAED